MEGTIRCSANYVPLSPISFLKRAAAVYGERDSVVYENVRYTWRETLHRCTKLASSLSQIGIARGDVVAVLSPNIPSMYELHFAVPMAGAIICTLNIRQDSKMISTILEHSAAKIIFVDYEYLEIAKGAFDILAKKGIELPRLVLVPESPYASTFPLEENLDYEKLLSMGKSDFEIKLPNDECDPISLNYTSGTTSSPKGVVYSHRGAYLNSLFVSLLQEMPSMPVYLWTVPMFHCNGWCFTWALAAQGGTNICLRTVSSDGIFESICRHKVTHMAGAPTVLNIIINSPARDRKPLPGKVAVLTGGAPPPPHVLFKIEELGFHVTHGYGLTETYGAATYCTWKPEWNSLPLESQAKIKSRQGLQHLGLEEVDVKDPKTMISVPKDAKTMGEVMLRGNTVMKGYLKDLVSTEEAFKDGWFRSGDIGVKHPDGYVATLLLIGLSLVKIDVFSKCLDKLK